MSTTVLMFTNVDYSLSSWVFFFIKACLGEEHRLGKQSKMQSHVKHNTVLIIRVCASCEVLGHLCSEYHNVCRRCTQHGTVTLTSQQQLL